jgi:hypothetical protein
MSTLAMLGNLAWAPVPAIESVEVLDRFNGVPTFGLFSTGGERQVFWRVTGYVPRSYSIWLYIPLTADDESRLSHAEPSDLLAGLVFGSSAPRYASVGVARDYRLIFEREWRIPRTLTRSDCSAMCSGSCSTRSRSPSPRTCPRPGASSCTQHLKPSASWRQPKHLATANSVVRAIGSCT